MHGFFLMLPSRPQLASHAAECQLGTALLHRPPPVVGPSQAVRGTRQT